VCKKQLKIKIRIGVQHQTSYGLYNCYIIGKTIEGISYMKCISIEREVVVELLKSLNSILWKITYQKCVPKIASAL
jgi:hypothetical protein